MKPLIFLFAPLLVFLAACSDDVFVYRHINTDPSSCERNRYSLENFTLYLRAVCEIRNGDSLTVPVDCGDSVARQAPGNKIVELSYLFVSPNGDKVVAINNIPDQNQRFFLEDVEKPMLEDRAPGEALKINAYPFSQFRFGDFHQSKASFTTTWRKPEDHAWIFEDYDDTQPGTSDRIWIKSYGEVTPTGINLVETQSALYLEPIYYRVDKWQLVLEHDDDHFEIHPRIWLEFRPNRNKKNKKRKIHTFFELKTTTTKWVPNRAGIPLPAEVNAIKFSNKRMYSCRERKIPCP